ncbi:HAMP domain-containing sensor histidine kinase [Angustibacter luteus]|uniref:histidine kinase n=1 Tax=Angustibacter luteus TaxID=658456 RepID=A0ABW1JF81_9ACTN
MRRRRPWGLRASVTVAFTGGALILSAVLAAGTYFVARHYLVDQRERTATRQAFADASFVRDGLLTSGAQVSDVLGDVAPPSDTDIVVHRGGRWFSSSLQADARAIPASAQQAVAHGRATLVWATGPNGRELVVGVPLPAVGAEFYEVSSPTELSGTLGTLRLVLFGFAVLTAIGGALLGRYAARRVVAPLDDVAAAAARISVGELSTRLPSTDDPDLAAIVGSFNAMVEALDERIQRDARFAADISHELRSPLTTLVTSVAVLQRRRDELPDRSQQALDLVATELDRFQRSLEDLLELGRLDAGVATQALSDVDLGDLVRHALQASHRATTPTLPTEPLVVRVDKNQLSRALFNLFDNADLHGGGLRAVAVERSGPDALVTVDDEGPGVPLAERTRIFERFVRAGSRGSRQGTGLGLSLVAETARAFHGGVGCTDRPGGGARFVLRLPLVAEGAAVAEPAGVS